jgi:hypothetical protein
MVQQFADCDEDGRRRRQILLAYRRGRLRLLALLAVPTGGGRRAFSSWLLNFINIPPSPYQLIRQSLFCRS